MRYSRQRCRVGALLVIRGRRTLNETERRGRDAGVCTNQHLETDKRGILNEDTSVQATWKTPRREQAARKQQRNGNVLRVRMCNDLDM